MLGNTNKKLLSHLVLATEDAGFGWIYIKKEKFVMTTNISDITSLQENKSFGRFEIRIYNKNQWYSYTYNVAKAKSGTNLWSHVSIKFTITQCVMVWFRISGDRLALSEKECTKHVAASKLYKNKLVTLSRVELVLSYQGYHPRVLNINWLYQGKPCVSKLKYQLFLNC